MEPNTQPNGAGDATEQVAALLRQNETANREAFLEREDVEHDAGSEDGADDTGDGSQEAAEVAALDASDHTGETGDESIDEGADDSAESEQSEHENLGVDWAGLAEKLGVTEAELYQIEMPMRNGREPVTFGQMKDSESDRLNLEQRRSEFEDARSEHEASVLRDQQDAMAIINALGDRVTPELVQLASARHSKHLDQQRELLLTAIPEWRDREAYSRDRQEIISTLAGRYAVTEQQIAAQTEAVYIQMMRDLARLLNEKKASKAQAKKVRRSPTRPGRKVAAAKPNARQTIIQTGKESSDPGDKVKAVAALLAKE